MIEQNAQERDDLVPLRNGVRVKVPPMAGDASLDPHLLEAGASPLDDGGQVEESEFYGGVASGDRCAEGALAAPHVEQRGDPGE